jgi:hypothetical protein
MIARLYNSLKQRVNAKIAQNSLTKTRQERNALLMNVMKDKRWFPMEHAKIVKNTLIRI